MTQVGGAWQRSGDDDDDDNDDDNDNDDDDDNDDADDDDDEKMGAISKSDSDCVPLSSSSFV